MTAPLWITPDWPAPPAVRALSTTRVGGVSLAPYDSLNLAVHVGDDPEAVRRNRLILREQASLPAEPLWLQQVHGDAVVNVARTGTGCEADGSFATAPGAVCAVMTADCLPVLLCDRQGSRVAALHAGWRGLAGGVIEAGVARLGGPGGDLLAWLGPAIGPQAFAVGDEVRAVFVGQDPQAASAFQAHQGRWLADIYALARLRLARLGVPAVFGGGLCTVTDRKRFFSYRRDGVCGRMATLIWLAGAE